MCGSSACGYGVKNILILINSSLLSRVPQGLYGIFVNLFQLGWYCTHPVAYGGCAAAGDEFSYFTILTYWGLAFYNLTAALHTLTYARTGATLLDRFPRPLQALHAFYYTTVTTYPFIVSIVYWTLIYPGTWYTARFEAWSNLSQHGFNSLFALFEIVVPRTSAPLWIHAWWLVFVLALYLSLAFVTYYTKHFYTYSFLDIQAQGSALTAGYILGIAVGAVVVFAIVRTLVVVRLWLTERKAGMDGRFAGHPLSSSGHDGQGLPTRDVELARMGKTESQSPVSGVSPQHL